MLTSGFVFETVNSLERGSALSSATGDHLPVQEKLKKEEFAGTNLI